MIDDVALKIRQAFSQIVRIGFSRPLTRKRVLPPPPPFGTVGTYSLAGEGAGGAKYDWRESLAL